jgi:hypothetical protein
MLGWLHRQQVSQAVVATVIAQAAAGLRVGPSRFDLAVRLLTAPGALVVAGFVRVARWFTWVPGVLGLWGIRAVFVVVAVWQCLQAHQATIAVTTGTLGAVSYTGPACARAWRRRVEAAADRWVARAGLGDHLEFAVRSADEPGSIDRVERLRRFHDGSVDRADNASAAGALPGQLSSPQLPPRATSASSEMGPARLAEGSSCQSWRVMPGPLGLHPRVRGREEGNGSRNDCALLSVSD